MMTEPDHGEVPEHDPNGLDLAAIIAAQTRSTPLPPPRGVRKRQRSRPRPIDPDIRSGSGPDARDPQLVGDLLDQLIQERGWTTTISAGMLLQRWPDLVGEVNARHSTVESFNQGEIVVRADSSTWATSLRSLAPYVVAEINRRLGDGSVTRLTVLGPATPSWKHGPRSVRDGRGPRDTYG